MAFWRKMRNLVRQRCPNCGEGEIYRAFLTMNPRCPQCGLKFEREAGYFMGSLYLSYGMAIIVMGLTMLVCYFVFPEWDSGNLALLAIVIFLPLAPFVSRYARIIWIYFDRWAWPSREGSTD